MSSLLLISTHSNFCMHINTIYASQLNVQPITDLHTLTFWHACQYNLWQSAECYQTIQRAYNKTVQLTCSGVFLAELWQPFRHLPGWPLWPSLANFVLQVSQHALQLVCHWKVAVLGQSVEMEKKTLTHKLHTNYRLSSLVQPMHILLTALCLFSCFINAQGGAAKWLWIKR